MDPTLTDTIDMHGDPLAFRFRQGSARSPLMTDGHDTIKIEARQMAGHQKEAVVTDGVRGSAWRLTSDEGKHLKGTDLAPFPLGFFNAGMQGDLYRRLRMLAAARGIALDRIEIGVVNHYWLTGSFIHGTGEGHAEPPDIEVRIESAASRDQIEALVADALDASPAIALLRAPIQGNTFALYINGRRRQVEGVANSPSSRAGRPLPGLLPRAASARRQRAARRDRQDRPAGAGHARARLAHRHQSPHPQYSRRGQAARGRRTVRGRYLARDAGQQPFPAGERRG